MNRSEDLSAVRRGDDLSIGGVVDMVKTYAKQETLGPLKGAGRWLAAGAAGALLLGVGLALVLLGVLRLIQTELPNLARGGWSWVPYLIVLAACALVIVYSITRINKSSLNKEPRLMDLTRQKGKAASAEKITRDDLEARFAGFQSGIKGKVESKRNTIVTAVSVGAVVLMLIVFLMGKRSGKRKTTLVEIRRV